VNFTVDYRAIAKVASPLNRFIFYLITLMKYIDYIFDATSNLLRMLLKNYLSTEMMSSPDLPIS